MTNLSYVKLQEGFDQYYQTRKEDDLDLVSEVRKCLQNYGLHQAVSKYFDTDPIIIDAVTKAPHIQRWLLNRYWTRQLVQCPVNSIEVRTYLIPDGSEEDWLRLFKVKVLPFIVDNNLPTSGF